MFYIFLSALGSALIGLLFKLSERYGVRIFHLVVLNYFAAAALGFVLDSGSVDWLHFFQYKWWHMAVLIGLAFVGMFFFVGHATRQVGVGVSMVAAKMSVVLPMLFSMWYYHEVVTWAKLLGMCIAVLAVVLAVLKPANLQLDRRRAYYPLLLFLGAGIIDSVVKLAQGDYVDAASTSLFSGVLFGVAAAAGVFISVLRREALLAFLQPTTLLFGASLGVANFMSFYFMVLALGDGGWDSSIVFGLNNIAVVLMSMAVAVGLFHEKLTAVNWLGVALAIGAIGLLAFA